MQIANAEVLPVDGVATCDDFLATTADYQAASKGLADPRPTLCRPRAGDVRGAHRSIGFFGEQTIDGFQTWC